ncbi:hypothetical protein N1851_009377 [Merluccius polli]|uniref:Uncharacterized protein n=1 Tax=Merluccius polli TaxID=89951 RepID=A0AA47P728_MERPO|nr:hypothetical protein N1851_009377 [Merluccius polli]
MAFDKDGSDTGDCMGNRCDNGNVAKDANELQRAIKKDIQKICKSKQNDYKLYTKKAGKRDRKVLKETDRKIIWVTPEVRAVTLQMELDTGSAVLGISHKNFVKKPITNQSD